MWDTTVSIWLSDIRRLWFVMERLRSGRALSAEEMLKLGDVMHAALTTEYSKEEYNAMYPSGNGLDG